MRKISIIVPTYNEKSTIETFIITLKKILKESYLTSELIVIDDHSDDGTTDILKKLKLNLIIHDSNKGYGAALKTGVLNASYDSICIIDADNEFPPPEIIKLLPYCNKYAMVVGCRVGKSTKSFPIHQKFAKFFICLLLGIIFKQKIYDINSGLRLIKKDLIKKYLPILCNGFSFTSGITLAMLIDKQKIKYVPVNYNRRFGKSKIKTLNYTLNFIKNYFQIIWYKLKCAESAAT